MARTARAAAAVVASMTLAAALSACGSSGDDSGTTASSGTTGASTSAAAPSGGTIKIGNAVALGTEGNNSPERLAAIKAAAAAINEQGGMNGMEVEIVSCNNGNDPNKTLACAKEFVDEGVSATVGSENSFGGTPAAQLLDKAGIPMIETQAQTPEEYNLPTSYLLSGGVDFQVAGMPLLAAKLLGAKTWYYVGAEYPAAHTQLELMEKVGDQLGLKLVGSSFLPLPTVPNFDPYAAKVAKSGADAVMVVTFPGQAIPMVNAVEDQGFHPDWIFNGDVPRPSDLKQLGKATERTYVAGDVPPLTAAGDHPQLQQYIDELDAYGQESGDEAADTSDVRGSTIRAWLAMQFINQVADQMKDGSAESLKAALDGAKDLQSDLIPPWNPSAKSCVPGYDRVSNPNLYFLKVQPSGDMELADEQTYDVSEYLC